MKRPKPEANYHDSDRLEGLKAIRRFIDPYMSERTFYRNHREALRPYLVERQRYWVDNLPRYYSFKPLILSYMMRRKML